MLLSSLLAVAGLCLAHIRAPVLARVIQPSAVGSLLHDREACAAGSVFCVRAARPDDNDDGGGWDDDHDDHAGQWDDDNDHIVLPPPASVAPTTNSSVLPTDPVVPAPTGHDDEWDDDWDDDDGTYDNLDDDNDNDGINDDLDDDDNDDDHYVPVPVVPTSTSEWTLISTWTSTSTSTLSSHTQTSTVTRPPPTQTPIRASPDDIHGDDPHEDAAGMVSVKDSAVMMWMLGLVGGVFLLH